MTCVGTSCSILRCNFFSGIEYISSNFSRLLLKQFTADAGDCKTIEKESSNNAFISLGVFSGTVKKLSGGIKEVVPLV